ncbi:hypothetical protein PM082_009622 [Marasmius tenuissimus]|nr:hypothetical protein PM082_009622 [Marasmius tenuissimus]
MQFSHSSSASSLDSIFSDVDKEVELFWNLGIIFVSVHLTINVFFTSVIVRKILRSGAHRTGVTSARERLRTVIALLVESCLLYLIVWIVLIACALAKLPNFTVIHSNLVQVAGIAPTLLIVRANTRKEEMITEAAVTHVRPPLMARSRASDSVDGDIVLHVIRDFNESKSP